MTLQFIGDVGIYIPEADVIKITAIHADTPVACYIKRSALMALGCRSSDDPAVLLATFERNRERLEQTAADKFRHGHFGDITVFGRDLLSAA